MVLEALEALTFSAWPCFLGRPSDASLALVIAIGRPYVLQGVIEAANPGVDQPEPWGDRLYLHDSLVDGD